jgi:hypothetical protein
VFGSAERIDDDEQFVNPPMVRVPAADDDLAPGAA